jgi:hypothetical protein
MHIIYKILFRSILLTTIVLIVHAVWTLVLYPVSTSELIGDDREALVQRLHSGLNTQSNVLFFCDSVDFYISPDDVDQRFLSQMIADGLPHNSIIAATGRAMHAGIYNDTLTYISAQQLALPNCVVIPINLRSFASYWVWNPGWQFNDYRRFLVMDSPGYRFLVRPLTAFRYYTDYGISQHAYDNMILRDRYHDLGLLKDYFGPRYEHADDDAISHRIDLYYAEPIQPDHVRLRDLIAIQQWGVEHSIPTIFYVTPVDIDIIRLKGRQETAEQVEANADFIINTLKQTGAEVYNLAFAFPSESFYYGEPYPNEHLNQTGRMELADKVIRMINQSAKSREKAVQE